MKRIGLFFDRSYVDAHSCFRELAMQFAGKGFLVDLYHISNPYNPAPVFFNDKIRVYDFPRSKFEKLEFWYKYFLSEDKKYDVLIGTPVEGGRLAYHLARKKKIPLVYLADEILDPVVKYHKIENWDSVKKTDIKINNFATCTIALGEERYQYQKKINKLESNHKYFVIPNSESGPSKRLKSNYFRDIFNIEDRKPIILFIGTMNWNLAKVIFEQTKKYKDKNYHIVFHGRTHGLIGEGDHPFIKISKTPLPSNLLNYAVSSADLGLVLYDKSIEQEKNNGWTGGKIGTYLKNELPLIAGNLDEFKKFETQNVGICWDGIEEIDVAINKAISQSEHMRQSIPSFYKDNCDYKSFFEPFYDFILENCK